MAAAVLSGLAATEATEYVVAPNGDDASAGSVAAPFRTIGKAAEVMTPGDVCLVRAGVYRETVRPTQSGDVEKPIVFRNWPDERPRVLGTDLVTGWKPVGDNLWRAPIDWDLDKHNQVFFDDQPGQEARWPNKTNRDPLDWEAIAYDKGSCNQFLLCSKLPDRPDGYWRGATLWVMGGAKWTSWSTVIKDYIAAEKKLLFDIPANQGSVGKYMSPSERRGGFFYLVGAKGEADQPHEWYLDGEAKTLTVCLPAGVDANTVRIEAKRRQNAFDLSERSHVQVIGFDVMGASLALTDSEHCLVKDMRATWIAHTRGGSTGYSLGESLGILIGGHHNTIRDSEIAYSAGNGIKLSGYRNSIINCWIHDTDYTGSYDAPVKMWGREMLVSHCTIHDTGRDCIQPPGQGHIIEYNNIFRMGRLAHDLGATYVCGSDGGGTEFRYNWCHDNVAHGTRMGIYLDNFTSDYFVYGNVVWNIGGCDIRLNKPSLRNVVVNNTMLGNSRNWGRWKTDWMYACVYANNAVTGEIAPHPQAVFAANRFKIPADQLNHENFQDWTAGADAGIAVPGIAARGCGVGAYESGGRRWTAGHDFANPPDARYVLADTPLRNLVRHGSFDWIEWRGQLGPWTPTGARSAEIVWGKPGGITNPCTVRDTIIGAGLCLSGEPEDGVEQGVAAPVAGEEYELSAWVKLKDGASVSISVRTDDKELVHARTSDASQWTMLTVRFTASAEPSALTVAITKTGNGRAFIDDIGLAGVIKGIEPRLPGFAR